MSPSGPRTSESLSQYPEKSHNGWGRCFARSGVDTEPETSIHDEQPNYNNLQQFCGPCLSECWETKTLSYRKILLVVFVETSSAHEKKCKIFSRVPEVAVAWKTCEKLQIFCKIFVVSIIKSCFEEVLVSCEPWFGSCLSGKTNCPQFSVGGSARPCYALLRAWFRP